MVKQTPYLKFNELYEKLKNLQVGKKITTIRIAEDKGVYVPNIGENHLLMLKRGWNTKTGKPNYEIIGQAKLTHIDETTAEGVHLNLIQKDTYPHYSKQDFFNIIYKFYGRRISFLEGQTDLVVLTLEVTEVLQ